MVRSWLVGLSMLVSAVGLTGCGGADVSDGVSTEVVPAGTDEMASEEMQAGEEESQSSGGAP